MVFVCCNIGMFCYNSRPSFVWFLCQCWLAPHHFLIRIIISKKDIVLIQPLVQPGFGEKPHVRSRSSFADRSLPTACLRFGAGELQTVRDIWSMEQILYINSSSHWDFTIYSDYSPPSKVHCDFSMFMLISQFRSTCRSAACTKRHDVPIEQIGGFLAVPKW